MQVKGDNSHVYREPRVQKTACAENRVCREPCIQKTACAENRVCREPRVQKTACAENRMCTEPCVQRTACAENHVCRRQMGAEPGERFRCPQVPAGPMSCDTDTFPPRMTGRYGRVWITGQERHRRGSRSRGKLSLRPVHVEAWQKPTQYCKAIIPPLKINPL